jgi:hypothetical protein
MGLFIPSKTPKKLVDCQHPPRDGNVSCVDIDAWHNVVCPPQPPKPVDDFQPSKEKRHDS